MTPILRAVKLLLAVALDLAFRRMFDRTERTEKVRKVPKAPPPNQPDSI